MTTLEGYGFTREQLITLSKAIAGAVVASRASHPQFVRADPKDHGISQAESQRRVEWCIGHVIWAREHRRWTVEHIRDKLPGDLGAYLDGRDPKENLDRAKGWMADGHL